MLNYTFNYLPECYASGIEVVTNFDNNRPRAKIPKLQRCIIKNYLQNQESIVIKQ